MKKFSTWKTIIKNSELPICSNCMYFGNNLNNYYDENKCKKFGEQNLVTGMIKYDLAENCRSDNNRCGTHGIGFTEKPNSFT